MSRPGPADPAKLVVGALVNHKPLLIGVAKALMERFGEIEAASRWLPFDYTSYYAPEMGGSLWRRVLVFQQLHPQENLAGIKLQTNAIEDDFRIGSQRSVNIDPGLLLRERFILATGKNFSHRIYVGNGIYADLTLIYRQGGFQTLPWTYPDYADAPIRRFLTGVRKRYARQLKSEPRRSV